MNTPNGSKFLGNLRDLLVAVGDDVKEAAVNAEFRLEEKLNLPVVLLIGAGALLPLYARGVLESVTLGVSERLAAIQGAVGHISIGDIEVEAPALAGSTLPAIAEAV